MSIVRHNRLNWVRDCLDFCLKYQVCIGEIQTKNVGFSFLIQNKIVTFMTKNKRQRKQWAWKRDDNKTVGRYEWKRIGITQKITNKISDVKSNQEKSAFYYSFETNH